MSSSSFVSMGCWLKSICPLVVKLQKFAVFKVGNIQRPESYEKVVRRKEAAKESIVVAENERPRALVEARSAKEQNITLAKIAIEKAQSEARVILSKARSEAEKIKATLKAEGDALKKLNNETGGGVQYLLSYLSTRAVADSDRDNYVGVGQPANTKFFS